MKKLNSITLFQAEKSTSDWSNNLQRFCQQFVLSQCLFHSTLIDQMLRGPRRLPFALCCLLFSSALDGLFPLSLKATNKQKERKKEMLQYVNSSNCFGALKME